MSLLPSARRLAAPLVVAALFSAAPAASANAGDGDAVASAAGVTATSSASRRPSPVRIRKRVPKAPRALPAGTAPRGAGRAPRRRAHVRVFSMVG